MGLLLSHPEVAYRSCSDCRKWYYDPKTGQLLRRWGKDKELLPIPRKPGERLPCWECPKCADSKEKSPEVGAKCELSQRNWQALRFYFQVKAVGGEVDAVARKNCGIIEWLLDQHRRLQGRMTVELLKMRIG